MEWKRGWCLFFVLLGLGILLSLISSLPVRADNVNFNGTSLVIANDGGMFTCENMSTFLNNNTLIQWVNASRICYLNQSLTVDGKLNITNETWYFTKRKPSTSSVNQSVFINGNLTLRNATLQVNGSVQEYGYMFTFTSTSTATIDTVRFRHFGSPLVEQEYGIDVQNANISFTNVDFKDGYNAVHYSGLTPSNIVISSSNFTNLTGKGLWFVAGTNVNITGNFFANNLYNASIYIMPSVAFSNLRIWNNTFVNLTNQSSNKASGIYLTPLATTNNITIANNTFNNTRVGVWFYTDVQTGDNYVIENNTFQGGCSGGSGVDVGSCIILRFPLSNGRGYRMVNNTFIQGDRAFFIYGIMNATIAYNTMTGMTGNGIISSFGDGTSTVLYTNISYNNISNLVAPLSGGPGVAFYFYSPFHNNTVQYNTFQNVSAALQLLNDTGGGNLISRNSFYDASATETTWIQWNASPTDNFFNDSLYGNWYESGISRGAAGTATGLLSMTWNSSIPTVARNWRDQKPVACPNGWNSNVACLSLRSPANNSGSSSTVFVAQTFGNTNVTNCTLYTNNSGSWTASASNSSVTTGLNVSMNFTVTQLPVIWNIVCTQSDGVNITSSDNYTLRNNVPLFVSNYRQNLTSNDASVMDTMIMSGQNENNTAGLSQWNFIGRSLGGPFSLQKMRTLIKWSPLNLSGITSSNVTLYLRQTAATNIGGNVLNREVVVKAFLANASWAEGTGSPGQSGIPRNNATLNGTTWNHRWFELNWTETGGDFDSSLSVNRTLLSNATGYTSFNITSFILLWHNGTYENNGLLLKSTNESSSSDYISVSSSESSTFPYVEYTLRIADVLLNTSANTTINVSGVFTDPDNQTLSYSCNATLASCSFNDSILTVAAGTTTGVESIVITANDSLLNATSNTFTLNVTSPSSLSNDSSPPSGGGNSYGGSVGSDTRSLRDSIVWSLDNISPGVPYGITFFSFHSLTKLTIVPAVRIHDASLDIRELTRLPDSFLPSATFTGTTYQSFQVALQNVKNEDVAEAYLQFKVPKAWIDEHGSMENVSVYRFVEENATWTELYPAVVALTDDNILFSVSLPHFSYFVIAMHTVQDTPVSLNESEQQVPLSEESFEQQAERPSLSEEREDHQEGPLRQNNEFQSPQNTSSSPTKRGVMFFALFTLLAIVIAGGIYFYTRRPKERLPEEQMPIQTP
ncbi:right-handed parallel beta-helix repeat-containing protein [Candidatus Woesearchaeota archaeon]|nr:right-handed parallel beta-helix repeat-containing protein [Candidatus Woesearchaeota archaeon]